MNKVPTFDQLMQPIFRALFDLGGSGSIDEIDEKVAQALALPPDILNQQHNPEKSSQTELQYRLAWARTYLKKYGLIENSSRGIWAIAPDKRQIESIDHQVIVRAVRDLDRAQREARERDEKDVELDADDVPAETQSWRERLRPKHRNRSWSAGVQLGTGRCSNACL